MRNSNQKTKLLKRSKRQNRRVMIKQKLEVKNQQFKTIRKMIKRKIKNVIKML